MTFVLDASVTLAVLFDEPEVNRIDFIALRSSVGFAAPVIWTLEILNVIALAERRSQFDDASIQEMKVALKALDVVTYPAISLDVAWDLKSLARRHALTVYDATYLQLAISERFGIATLDRELRLAASGEGLKIWP